MQNGASPEDLWLSACFSGFCRLEEAVPKTCLALDDQRENDGEQQELQAALPAQMQLELEDEVREGMGNTGGLGMVSKAQKKLGVSWGTLGLLEDGRSSVGPCVLAQHALGCGLLANPLNFPGNKHFGDQTRLKCGLTLG